MFAKTRDKVTEGITKPLKDARSTALLALYVGSIALLAVILLAIVVGGSK